MFYHSNELRKGGRFHECWVADKWPTKFRRWQASYIMKLPVPLICDMLREVIDTESSSVRQRFSLRLSSQLLMGLLVIYQRQVNIVCEQALFLSSNITKKKIIIIAPKKKQRPQQQQVQPPLPEPLLPELSQEELVQITNMQTNQNMVLHRDEITLREETLASILPTYDGFGDPTMNQGGELETMLQKDFFKEFEFSVEAETSKIQEITQVAIENPIIEIPLQISTVQEEVLLENLIPDIQITTLQPDKPAEKPLKRKAQHESFQLESLEPIQQVKKRKNEKLIKDKEILISSEIIKKRIAINELEQRCELPGDDVVNYRNMMTDSSILLCSPATQTRHFFEKRQFSKILCNKFKENLITRHEPNMRIYEDVSEEQAPEVQRKAPKNKSLANSFMLESATGNLLDAPQPRKYSKQPQMIEESPVSLAPAQTDKSITLNPVVDTTIDKPIDTTIAELNFTIDVDQRPSKKRKTKQAVAQEMVCNEQNEQSKQSALSVKRGNQDISFAINQNEEMEQSVNEQVSTVHQNSQCINGTEINGSMERTQVALGDTTILQVSEEKQYLNDNWSPKHLVEKILNAMRAGQRPLTFDALLKIEIAKLTNRSKEDTEGPITLPCRPRMIASRAFVSLLTLKEHDFVKVITDENSSEIKQICVTETFKRNLLRK